MINYVSYYNPSHLLRLEQHTQELGKYDCLGVRRALRVCVNKIPVIFLRKNNDQELVGKKIESRTIKVSTKRINSCILKNVKGMEGNDIQAWKNDEKKVYLSRVLNQEIDKFCKINNCGFSSHQREQVFNLVSKYYDIVLDSSCAQSSINQMVSGNKYFRNKMDKLCQGMNRNEKNSIEYDFVNKLSDDFYQKNIQSIDLHKFRNDVANFISEARINTLMWVD